MTDRNFFEPEDVLIEESIVTDLPGHQVLLSFEGDEQAEAFVDWWTDTGILKFSVWTAKHGNDYL